MNEENKSEIEETEEGGELGNAGEQPPETASVLAVAEHPTPERKVPTKLLAWIDNKLKGNGLAQHAIEQKDARTVMRLAAEACVGIREQGGNNRGPLVDLIQDVIGQEGKEHWAWCMSFVQVCIAYAEEKTGVKSPIIAHEHCLTVWNQSPKNLRCTADPLPGAIIVWRHGDTASGHTGILTSFGPDSMTAVEGNTESGVAGGKVERDGGGVYATKRSKTGAPAMRVMGFLKPF
jgi:hypothetical protein